MLVLFHPSSMNIFLQVRIKRKRFRSHVGMIFGNEVLSTVVALLPRVEIGYCRVRESWPGEVRMPGGDIRQEEAWQQGEGTKGDGAKCSLARVSFSYQVCRAVKSVWAKNGTSQIDAQGDSDQSVNGRFPIYILLLGIGYQRDRSIVSQNRRTSELEGKLPPFGPPPWFIDGNRLRKVTWLARRSSVSKCRDCRLAYFLWTSLLFPGHIAYDSTVFLTSCDHELQCNPQRQNAVVQIFKSQPLTIFSDF